MIRGNLANELGLPQGQTQPPSLCAGVPIHQPQSQTEAHPDACTASLVTIPPRIASETMDLMLDRKSTRLNSSHVD